MLKRLLKLRNMLVKEDLNRSEQEKTKEEQIRIKPQSTQPTPIQSGPSEEIKPPVEPFKKEEINPVRYLLSNGVKPEQKPKKEKKQKKKNPTVVNKDKVIKINGKNVLMVPSGFEIMTKDGWRSIMMRADKIHKGY